jgi:menaquinone-dependent protoporphyrinogen oxidase
MRKVGVFWASREGQAHEIALRVAATMLANGCEVMVVGMKEPHAASVLAGCGVAVVVASIHLGKHEPEAVAFVKQHRAELAARPAAFLSVCTSEAVVEDLSIPAPMRAAAAARVKQQLAGMLDETDWHPAHVLPVAGALLYTHYNPLVRWAVKRIAKSEGLPTDTSRDHELTDWVSLDDFARRLAAEITRAP